MFNKVAILAVLLATLTQATEITLKDKITQSLESLLASQAEGVENCENKCDKAFNRFAYDISTSGQPTYEFQACVAGCNQCMSDIASSATPDNCFRYCKNRDWQSDGIVKGVIEPDKACIGGCVIQTCQVICMNGSELPLSKATKPLYYPNGGCTIKTQPYSQYAQYVPWNSPNTLQGGSAETAQCCSNALSLCQYVGNKATTNYNILVQVTQKYCKQDVPSGTVADICAFFNDQRNCGTGATV